MIVMMILLDFLRRAVFGWLCWQDLQSGWIAAGSVWGFGALQLLRLCLGFFQGGSLRLSLLSLAGAVVLWLSLGLFFKRRGREDQPPAMGEGDIHVLALLALTVDLPMLIRSMGLSLLLLIPGMILRHCFQLESEAGMPYLPFLGISIWMMKV